MPMRRIVGGIWRRFWRGLPPRAQELLFELVLRSVAVAAARCTREPMRFALNELAGRRGVRRYTLRASGRVVFVRHPLCDAWVLSEVFGRRVYEPPSALGRVLAEPGEVRVVDLGGHVGAATVFLLDRFPAAKVLALEPDPENASLFRRTIEANGLGERCELRQAAAGTDAGTATFEGFSLLAHLTRHDSQEAVDRIPVLRKYQERGLGTALVDVVDVLPLLAGADLVKMDIEGAEWPILADSRFGSLGIGAIVLEYHPEGAPQPDAIQEATRLLRGAGLTVGDPFEVHGQVGLLWAWRE
jgi:FkbM family methyltransferase